MTARFLTKRQKAYIFVVSVHLNKRFIKVIEAVGTIFLSLKTKRVMLGLRCAEGSHPLTWSFFGGKVEKGESLGEALERARDDFDDFYFGEEVYESDMVIDLTNRIWDTLKEGK